jgi:hypothetical protein
MMTHRMPLLSPSRTAPRAPARPPVRTHRLVSPLLTPSILCPTSIGLQEGRTAASTSDDPDGEPAGPLPGPPRLEGPRPARTQVVASGAVGERQQQGQERAAVPGGGQAGATGLDGLEREGQGRGDSQEQGPPPAPASPGPRQAAPIPSERSLPRPASAAAPDGTPATSQAAAAPTSGPPGTSTARHAAAQAGKRAVGDGEPVRALSRPDRRSSLPPACQVGFRVHVWHTPCL